MQYIHITKGYRTAVDDEDYERLNQYSWYASGVDFRPARRRRDEDRKLIYIYHDVLEVLPWIIKTVGLVVDHKDRNPLNNQKSNLRLVSQKENMRNTFLTGMRQGVCFDSTHGKYKAYLDRTDLPRINIGTFLNKEDALAALTQTKLELGCEDN